MFIVLYFNVHSLLLNFLFNLYLSCILSIYNLKVFNILFVLSLYCIVCVCFLLKIYIVPAIIVY